MDKIKLRHRSYLAEGKDPRGRFVFGIELLTRDKNGKEVVHKIYGFSKQESPLGTKPDVYVDGEFIGKGSKSKAMAMAKKALRVRKLKKDKLGYYWEAR